MINVVGLGPGSKKYILPAAIDVIKSSSLVIGAKRNLKSINEYCKESMDLSIGLNELGIYLKENQTQNLTVVVSGDTGFYSLLSFVKRNVENENINVIPGISSLQYFYGKLNRGYENSKWISLHGRETELEPYLKKRVELGILTDQEHNSRYIAEKLNKLGIHDAKIYIGERLSYNDEKICCLTIQEGLKYIAEDLSVVVISYE